MTAEAEGDFERQIGGAMGADAPARQEAAVDFALWKALDQRRRRVNLAPLPKRCFVTGQVLRSDVPCGRRRLGPSCGDAAIADARGRGEDPSGLTYGPCGADEIAQFTT
ncbi:hypothetical protein ACLGIH_11930 [Streptomyces sp. HMX87]|uniref:hypothetical protein n=1 Tax=Streptomyces sp. HMX87 TaxID=3390849 RepID=UPI003A893361